jgi:starch phosphorylase
MTNGISFRRWLFEANPNLTTPLTRTLGERVLTIQTSSPGSSAFPMILTSCSTMRRPGRQQASAGQAHPRAQRADGRSGCDVRRADQAINEYKRQLLNILEIIALYLAIRLEPDRAWTPRVKIFAGKPPRATSAPLIMACQRRRPGCQRRSQGGRPPEGGLLPNYNVSLARLPFRLPTCPSRFRPPAWRPGTGNMKLG